MLSKLIEKMKFQMTMKTAKGMDFRSESARSKFEVVRENNPDSAEFIEDWARLMQKRMHDDMITDSLLWNTYSMVNACHEAGVDLHRAKALLTMYWRHGDKLVSRDKSA